MRNSLVKYTYVGDTKLHSVRAGRRGTSWKLGVLPFKVDLAKDGASGALIAARFSVSFFLLEDETTPPGALQKRKRGT